MGRPKHNRNCKICGIHLDRHEKAFCSRECANKQHYLDFIQRWKQGLEHGMRNSELTSRHIHRYIREKYGDKCSNCGWDRKNPETNNVPIQMHHKDGNCENNKEENLELLCPNCHSLTLNYMNLNKGKGRKLRYKN